MAETNWLINAQNGVYYLTPPASEFEAAYTTVRAKELRLLSDEEVKLLPRSSSKPDEWKKRAWTLADFQKSIRGKTYDRTLDIGCGNGWFTSVLREHSAHVIGLDVGQYELEQAARCFSDSQLDFVCCTDWDLLPAEHFDCITFNGSLQYFELNESFWASLFRLLNVGGEIHILDTPFYAPKERSAAEKRSKNYFESVGVPAAASYYRHLSWTDLPLPHSVHYRPKRILNKLFASRSPFPRITIHKPS